MTVEIPLHDKSGNVTGITLISTDDEELVKKYKWHCKEGKYACGYVNREKIRLHHLIFGKPPHGMVVDHINRNSLDNRRENLRFATRSQNSQNTPSQTNKYFGIYLDKRDQMWQSRCMRYSLGRYKNQLMQL
jgi:hypothetical protein